MQLSKFFTLLAAGLIALNATASDAVPVHRPLIEEYTGTWCGYCVRGLAGMELLSLTFGDEFIGVAYHEGDAMEIMYTDEYPNDVYGFPTAFIERTTEVDPLYGMGNTSGGIVSVMRQFAALPTIAGIDVTAQWTDENRTTIDVDVTSWFTTDDASGKYALEIMLIADDLHGSGSGWNQTNYYSGDYNYAKDRYLGPWVQKPYTVTGYHFFDVLVGTSRVIARSLPRTIVAYQDYNFKYSFILSNLPAPSLIQNKDNLHVIAIVVDTSNGHAINANRCYIDEYVPAIPGDVTNDGTITIEDVTVLIDYLLTGDASTINADNSDVDGDGNITISDVTELIDLLLRGE
jgi:hypothetical protein